MVGGAPFRNATEFDKYRFSIAHFEGIDNGKCRVSEIFFGKCLTRGRRCATMDENFLSEEDNAVF